MFLYVVLSEYLYNWDLSLIYILKMYSLAFGVSSYTANHFVMVCLFLISRFPILLFEFHFSKQLFAQYCNNNEATKINK